MSLAKLIQGKSVSGSFATVTPATLATPDKEKGRTVATVATVAVAISPVAKGMRQESRAMAPEHEATIREWLGLLGEKDPEEIAQVVERCRKDHAALAYALKQAAEIHHCPWMIYRLPDNTS